MRKLIYHIAASLDGFIARPDGSTDDFLASGTFMADFVESIATYGAVLMGRKTYEYGFQYGLQKGQPAYAEINPNLTNYIFSRTMEFAETKQIQLVRKQEVDFVESLKAQAGKPIWLCGGGDLAGTLLDAKLIDELIIKLNPVFLSDGIRLFGQSQVKAIFTLTDTKSYENGLVRLTYQLDYP